MSSNFLGQYYSVEDCLRPSITFALWPVAQDYKTTRVNEIEFIRMIQVALRWMSHHYLSKLG